MFEIRFIGEDCSDAYTYIEAENKTEAKKVFERKYPRCDFVEIV